MGTPLAMTARFDPVKFLSKVGDGKAVSNHPPGDVIFRQGTRADHVFYLQSGRVKETVTSDQGKHAVVGILGPGLFFGASSLYVDELRLSTATTLTSSIITSITKEAMREALYAPPFAQLFMAYLLANNSKIEAEKIDLLFNGTEKRLAQRLLLLAHVDEGPAQKIGPEITQEMLAEMIGTTRPRVNYFLNRFRKMGLVKYNGGIVVLPTLLKAVLIGELKDGEEHK